MNWEKIQSKYPKAFQLLCDYHENEVVGLIDHPTVWDQDNLAPTFWELRHLYDFFDENEIYLEVYRDIDGVDHILIAEFLYMIWTSIYDSVYGAFYNSRREAEQAAFTKAFELLENKL